VRKAKVTLVFRKPLPSTHSIEYLFHNIYNELVNRLPVQEFELPCYSKGVANRIWNILSIFKFRKGIVHITGDCHYAILGAFFCKRILTIHDLSFLDRTTGIKRLILKLLWVDIPVRFSHRITSASEMTKNMIVKETGIAPENITVIKNFIDPVYKPVYRKFNAQRPRILQVGTAFNKNIERLAEALRGIDCTLMIIGRLSQSQISALDDANVHYLNRFSIPLQELHKEYLAADLMAFVSTVEGFGIPILEAQATGLPIVTSNCSSMPEVAGNGAQLVDPFDVSSIRSGILNSINDEKRRTFLVEEGYKNVQKYSKSKVAEQYLSVYQEFIS
jgi:glycosyltransferase involved in cell wall biosynthesis